MTPESKWHDGEVKTLEPTERQVRGPAISPQNHDFAVQEPLVETTVTGSWAKGRVRAVSFNPYLNPNHQIPLQEVGCPETLHFSHGPSDADVTGPWTTQ